MSRLALGQLILFVLVAIVVIPYGVYDVAGPQGLTGRVYVHSTMTDALGLTAGTGVSYRGVQIGRVSSVGLQPDGSVRVEYSIGGDIPVPADSVALVTMSTAAGIQNVDIRPHSDGPPYLVTGDEVPAPADAQPVQMDRILLEAGGLLRSIDPNDIATLGDELGASFRGLDSDLVTMIDGGGQIAERLDARAEEIRDLITRSTSLITTTAQHSEQLVRGIAAAREVTGGLDANGPTLVYLLDSSPAALDRARGLFDTYHGTFGQVLLNLATVQPIIADRTASLATGLDAIPYGLAQLSSIVSGDRANFTLVATQGPVCNYPTERRAVGDLTPVEPNLGLYCPPAPNLSQRGAMNAPRPNDLGLQGLTTPGDTIGPPIAADPILIPTGIEALGYWRSLMEGLSDAPR
ncbi:MlaD family protein [Millisia brevis]|uniref:MlaD family protein n=1 Tax=Millisia brevis TaxID=264148 RepID=UPI00082CA387|nr:MlaD family protein [Millisia brevis]